MSSRFSVDVESYTEEEINKIRYRWRLKAMGEADLPSTTSFATRREAEIEAKLALERAVHRGTLRFTSGRAKRSPALA